MKRLMFLPLLFLPLAAPAAPPIVAVQAAAEAVATVPTVSGPYADHDDPILPGTWIELRSTAGIEADVDWDVSDEAIEPHLFPANISTDAAKPVYAENRVLVIVPPDRGAQYTLTVTCDVIDWTAHKRTKTRHRIHIGSPVPVIPPTATLDATPTTITKGDSATLTWSTANAASVKLDGVAVLSSGTRVVSPLATTSYTLAATTGATTVSAQRVVTVSDLPPPPIAEPGLRVLFTYNSAKKASLPREEIAMLDSPTLREWLSANCAKSADGTPEWRFWDMTKVVVGADQPLWQKLAAVPRAGDFAIVATNGIKLLNIPLPAREADTIAWLRKLVAK